MRSCFILFEAKTHKVFLHNFTLSEFKMKGILLKMCFLRILLKKKVSEIWELTIFFSDDNFFQKEDDNFV